MLPKKIYLNYVDEDDEEKTWCVDPVYVHCDMQNREYTDLSQVWHNAKEEPEKGKQIISIGSTGVSALSGQMNGDAIGWILLNGLSFSDGHTLKTCYRKEVSYENVVSKKQR